MAALGTIISIVEIIILLVATCTGMAVAIMIGITRTQMSGLCILRAGVEQGDNLQHFTFTPSGYSRCQFCLVIHVFGVLMAFGFALYRLQVVCRRKFDIQVMGRMLISLVFGLMTFLLFVEACLVSVGFNTFCNRLLGLEGDWPKTCREFQNIDWTVDEGEANGSHFYDNLTTAVAASWISVLLWLALTGISLASCFIIRRRGSKSPKRAAAENVQDQAKGSL